VLRLKLPGRYLGKEQPVRIGLNDYAPRIERKQSTTHKQTIWAKLTGIYAVKRNYLCTRVKRSIQVRTDLSKYSQLSSG
jgi:hypothetical protein